MLRAAQAYLAQAYTRGVQGRYRVLLDQLLAIQRRCDRESRCARQAAALIDLLLVHQREREAPPPAADGAARVYRALVMREDRERGEEEDRAPGILFLAALGRGGGGRSDDNGRMARDRREEECFALLDGPDRLLSMQRTRALALATVREAMLQALQDHAMQHEQASMRLVVLALEGLERQLLAAPRFQGWRDEDGEEEQQALLKHLGRGIELMERVARLQQQREAALC